MSAAVVRPIRDDDRDAVLEVVLRAFQSLGQDGSEEVDIVRRTWELDAALPGLDLVAEVNGELVGHVLGSRVDLGGRNTVGIAPLSVHPGHQGRGVGATLMENVLRAAEEQGWPLVVLLGAPEYYGRFGFQPAGDFGIVYPPVGAGDRHFQVWLGSAFDPSWRGEVIYCWEGPGS